MIKLKLVFLLSVIVTGNCSAQQKNNFLVGTYTDSSNQGINYINFDEKSKTISLLQVVSEIDNPSFVIANKSKSYVIAIEETASDTGGKVTSYSFNNRTNTFKKISTFFTRGNHPCTLALSPKEDYVIVGNYSGGNLSVFPINKEGKLSDCSQFIQYEGNSENLERQEKPHVHCIAFHPKNKIIAVSDLGSDVIRLIPFDNQSNSLLQESATQIIKVASGSGPRHLLWNKAGTRLYATYELTNEIGVFEFRNNQLILIKTLGLTAPTKNGSAAELRLSNDEQFLYASVRGNDNEIVVMKVDESIILEKIQSIKTAKTPRNFILTNDQQNLLVANQNSNLISVFERDIKTGLLKATSSELTINKPVYLFSL